MNKSKLSFLMSFLVRKHKQHVRNILGVEVVAAVLRIVRYQSEISREI